MARVIQRVRLFWQGGKESVGDWRDNRDEVLTDQERAKRDRQVLRTEIESKPVARTFKLKR